MPTHTNFTCVILESPFAHEKEFERNIAYTRACMRDCLLKGEAPFASHLLYTQIGILNDLDPYERALGIEAGLQWGVAASKSVVYIDLGISAGMRQGIQRALEEGRTIEQRNLPGFQEWFRSYQLLSTSCTGVSGSEHLIK